MSDDDNEFFEYANDTSVQDRVMGAVLGIIGAAAIVAVAILVAQTLPHYGA